MFLFSTHSPLSPKFILQLRGTRTSLPCFTVRSEGPVPLLDGDVVSPLSPTPTTSTRLRHWAPESLPKAGGWGGDLGWGEWNSQSLKWVWGERRQNSRGGEGFLWSTQGEDKTPWGSWRVGGWPCWWEEPLRARAGERERERERAFPALPPSGIHFAPGWPRAETVIQH